MNDLHVEDTDFLIIGSGTGAVAVAEELVAKGRYVTVVESGKRNTDWGSSFLDRAKRIYKPDGNFSKSEEGIHYYRHIGFGGSLEISCGNGVLPGQGYLDKTGLDIQPELEQVHSQLGITSITETLMGQNTKILLNSARNLGLDMSPTPKFINFEKCRFCAKCETICQYNARWSVAKQFETFESSGKLRILDGIKVERIEFEGQKAVAATGTSGTGHTRIHAGIIILAAGGIGTPVILQNSGITAGQQLHLDLFVNIYGRSDVFNNKRDLPMAAVYEHPDDSFIIAPYLDADLWYAFNEKNISSWLNGKYFNGLMVKIADQDTGQVSHDTIVKKKLETKDQDRLRKGIDLSKKILVNAGADKDSIVTTNVYGAHPGGTAAIGTVTDTNLKVNQTQNLYVADASILPESLGKPPILTIMALAKRLGKQLAL